MSEVKVEIVTLDELHTPVYKHEIDACLDCKADTEGKKKIIVWPKSRKLISLGFRIGIPEGYEGQIRPRSGLTSKSIDNGLGTIDPGYTGVVKACVINHSWLPFVVRNGDRICQLVIKECPKVKLIKVDSLEATERGDSGFGSTGI